MKKTPEEFSNIMDEKRELERNEQLMKSCFQLSLTFAALTAYFSYMLAQRRGSIFYYGFVLTAILILAALYFRSKNKRYKDLLVLKTEWGNKVNRKRNLKNIKTLFTYVKEENKDVFYIDDQTWEDLTMDKIYEELDRTHTTPGEQLLYYILRTPAFKNDTLLKRKAIIELFQTNKNVREEIQLKLFNLGRDPQNSAAELIWSEIPSKNNMRLLFNMLAILPIVSVLIMPFNLSLGITLFIALFGVNLYIHYTKGKEISSYVDGINYLAGLISTAKQVSNIKAAELQECINVLKENAEVCSKIAKKTSSIGRTEGIDMFADYVYILTLSKERQYYNAINRISSYRTELKTLLMKLGELDALLSIASYREGVKSYTEPCLDNEKAHLNVEGVRHPLIKEPIPNSISINESGIVLTGSNMSGKSTFLRTIGVNALFAQTIYTCSAESYCGSFFKIISSISPSDNLLVGKSYYLGEAEALLRIIKSCDKEVPSLCIIDEIFRGTNPIERISASAEILNYLVNNNSLVIVATHDLELTEMVNNYGCYYFTEDVDDEGLKFDYKLKKGVSPTRNAIKLLKYLGYPSEIIDRTNTRVDKITEENVK